MNDIRPCGNNEKWCESCVSKGKCNYTKKQDIIAELEKIKADIIKYHQIECNRNCDNCKYIDCIEAEDAVADIKIIDKRISELKGE